MTMPKSLISSRITPRRDLIDERVLLMSFTLSKGGRCVLGESDSALVARNRLQRVFEN